MGNSTVNLPRNLSLPVSAESCCLVLLPFVFPLSVAVELSPKAAVTQPGTFRTSASCVPIEIFCRRCLVFIRRSAAANQPASAYRSNLYAAGFSGNGSAPSALLSSPSQTAADGSFSVASGYTCPWRRPLPSLESPREATYRAANSAMMADGRLALAAASLRAVPSRSMRFQPLHRSGRSPAGVGRRQRGRSCTNSTGLDNAFATANELVNTTTGASPGATFLRARRAHDQARLTRGCAHLVHRCAAAVPVSRFFPRRTSGSAAPCQHA